MSDEELAASIKLLRQTDLPLYQTADVWEAAQLFRQLIWLLLSDPHSSRGGYIISLWILILIAVSSITLCMETMEEFYDDASQEGFRLIELICIIIFTTEYVLKLITAPKTMAFVVGPLNIVDLVSILPWYLERMFSSALAGTQILRIVRLVRVFRVLKLGSRYGKIQVVWEAVVESSDMLFLMIFLLMLSVIVFSTLIYFAEKGQWDSELERYVRAGEFKTEEDGTLIASPFVSIPSSFWWCMVTLMTVGYGDLYPVTGPGRLVAVIAMLASILILALPISVIGTNFDNKWNAYKEREKYKASNKLQAQPFIELTAGLSEHCGLVEDISKKAAELETDIAERVTSLQETIMLRKEAISQMKANERDPLSTLLGQDEAELGGTSPVAQPFQAMSKSKSTASLGGILIMEEEIVRREASLLRVLESLDLLQNKKFPELVREIREKYNRMGSAFVESQSTMLELRDLHEAYEELGMPKLKLLNSEKRTTIRRYRQHSFKSLLRERVAFNETPAFENGRH
ncbi:hypothetical protein CYMTET_53170 [Cymbomonas tetramitiformis]|uniref:Ion transport domain-containing protein n=1 Tax=Cymbomonas tetramitiformis TaxID=36881 RepID=A0AAE0BIY3_9CHLO|nr:hypothetical protein CYMTET_53170 [Cymbomonas tetramitiformis]